MGEEFSHTREGGLAVLSSQLVSVVQALKKVHSTNIAKVLHADNVKVCLVLEKRSS